VQLAVRQVDGVQRGGGEQE